MNKLRQAGVALLLLLTLAGCGSMDVKDFAGTEPRFRIEEFFAGKTKAWGIFEDRFGNLRREFVVDIEGYMEGDEFVLVEDFVYSDGETEQRVWRLKILDEHRYEGSAPGVTGKATGAAYGKAFHWTYNFDLKIKDRMVNVHFNDWMFLQPDNVVVNKATVSKFGITLGVATIFFQKVAQEETQAGFLKEAAE